MAGIKIVDLPPLGRDLASTDLLELSLAGGTGSRKITGQEIMNTSKLNIGTTAITSGTVGRVLFQGTGNVVQQSANFTFDTANIRFNLGTTLPSIQPANQNIVGSSTIVGVSVRNTSTAIGSTQCGYYVENNSTSFGQLFKTGTNYTTYKTILANDLGFYNGNSGNISILNDFATGQILLAAGASSTANLAINSTGNVLINTTTDAGFKLDVNGTARVVTSIQVNNKTLSGGASALTSNTAYGASTLTAVNALGFNTAIGNVALQNNLGEMNTAVGSHSLNQNSSGSQNVGIGGYAGSSVTSGSNNVLIGYNSQLGSGGQSNQIVIGHGATGAGSNTATLGNDSITTTVLKGNVGIGTSSPAFPLDILGSSSIIGMKLRNSLSSGYTEINLFNNSGGNNDRMYMGVGGTTTGDAFQNRGYFFSGSNLEGINFTANKATTGDIRFFTGGVNERLRIHGSGNIGINTTTDAGFRLDVNGTARVATTLTVGSTSGAGLVNITRSDGGIMTTINSPDACTINNLNGNGVRINVDSVNYFHVRGFASQFAVNVTGALTSNAGFTRALLVNNVINANANNVELAAVYISPTFNNLAFTGVKNIAIQSASGGAHFNTTSVDVSSILQADSTTKGFLPPRMTQTQRNAIASPAIGLEIYQTDATEGKYIYKSSGWTYIG